MQELKQMRDVASLFMIILFGRIVGLSTFLWRGAQVKGLLLRVAISPGLKGCRLKSLYSPGRLKNRIENIPLCLRPSFSEIRMADDEIV